VAAKTLFHNPEATQNWSVLMSAARAGDEAAYQELLEEISPVLLNYFRKKTGRLEDAQELCQGTLLRIHSARRSYDPQYPFGCWMYSIARNLMCDHVRSQFKRDSLFAAVVDEVDEATEQGCEYCAVLAREASLQLTSAQSRAVHQIHFLGKSFSEVATSEKITVNALKVRLHRAKETLTDFLSTA
jgi:RNA polymerase sigma-70 factor, ECF subfamily